MKCAGHRTDIVEPHCNRLQSVKDPHTFDGKSVLCSSTRLVRIEIDANYFACAVRDCFWSLHYVGEAYKHAKVDHCNTGQPVCIVHVGNAADYLRQKCVCELGVQWPIAQCSVAFRIESHVTLRSPPVTRHPSPVL